MAEVLPFVLASGKLLPPEEEAVWVDAFGGVLCRDPCLVSQHTGAQHSAVRLSATCRRRKRRGGRAWEAAGGGSPGSSRQTDRDR